MCRISSKSVNNCFCYRAPKFRDRKTDRQTDRQTEKTKVVQNSILSIYIYSKFISTTPISDFRKCLSECMIPFGYIYEGYNKAIRKTFNKNKFKVSYKTYNNAFNII